MKVSWALFLCWLFGIRLWKNSDVDVEPTAVLGQPIDDDSIDDKFLDDDNGDELDPNRGLCDVNGYLRQYRAANDDTSSSQLPMRPTARFPALFLIGWFLVTRICILISPEYRWLWSFQKASNRCSLGLSTQRRCICRQSGLVQAIQNNQNATLCFDAAVEVSKEIDITNKTFNISCVARRYGDCRITGNKSLGRNSTRLFKGSPKHAVFHQIDFNQFSGDEGGVALLTGGKMQFDSCSLYDNEATVGNGGALSITGGAKVELIDTRLSGNIAKNGNGGAISITGPGSTLNYERISMSNGWATNGGAMYVANGAKVTSSSFFWRASYNYVSQLGGAFYVDRASVFLKGPMRFNLAQLNETSRRGVLSSVWIADDDDPSLLGSNVECGRPAPSSQSNRTRVAYCGLGEFAAGLGLGSSQNQTQLFANTNCLSLDRPLLGVNSTVQCWTINGTCLPNVTDILPC